MKTWSGKDAPFLDKAGGAPPALLDLTVHLGREMRFGGWGSREWSVLHHSFLCALIWLRGGFPKEKLAYALLHDAHEAYVGDIPTPLKRAYVAAGVGEAMDKVSDRFQAAILALLNTPWPDDETEQQVSLVDFTALLIEAPLFGTPGTYEKILREASEGERGSSAQMRVNAARKLMEEVYRA